MKKDPCAATHDHDWICVSEEPGPDATYNCRRCGLPAYGDEIPEGDYPIAPGGRLDLTLDELADLVVDLALCDAAKNGGSPLAVVEAATRRLDPILTLLEGGT